jgi:hypothetical protein
MERVMKKKMLRISQFAPLAFVVAAFLLAGPAHAQRGCAFAINCTPAECEVYQAAVKSPDACGSPAAGNAPLSCAPGIGCSTLRARKQRWLSCYTARVIINEKCFLGGDLGHQQAAAQAATNLGNCDNIIALPEPEGCKDPCSE